MDEQSSQPAQNNAASHEPVRHRRANTVLIFVATLLLAIIGVLSFLLVQEQQNNEQQVVELEETLPVNDGAEPEAEAALLEYINEAYGVSFSYPAEWGAVATDTLAGESEAGQAISGRFENRRNILFGVQAPDYQPPGGDGGCYVTLGIGEERFSYFDTENSDETINEDVKGSEYRIINEVLDSDESVLITKHYEAGRVEGPGSCLGFSSRAGKLFTPSDKAIGIEFFFGTRENSLYDVPLEWAEEYTENPDYFYDAEDFAAFVEMVKSSKGI